MASLKYTVIKNREQYDEYCNMLEDLNVSNDETFGDEIDLLTMLIEKWDSEHNTFGDKNPIEILQVLMNDHHLKAKDLAAILGLSKGTISKILNYRKGLSKETIRKLAAYFKISQEAFNRPYELLNEENRNHRAGLRDARKTTAKAG